MKAIIFDLDGVLVDSKKAHLQALKQMFESKGVTLTKEELRRSFGFAVEQNIEMVCKARGLSCPVAAWADEKRRIALRLLKKTKLFPGVEQFLSYVKSRYKVGLASSSSIPELEAALKDLKQYFDCVVTLEDVKKHKPDPEAYLLVAKKLGVKPKECLVIEDSIAGVEAAKRAGMFCVAVLNSFPAKELRSADVVVSGLDDPRLGELC